MPIDMGKNRHLWVVFNKDGSDKREVIIDKEKDVRVCDGHHVVKIRFIEGTNQIRDVLVDDVFAWMKEE